MDADKLTGCNCRSYNAGTDGTPEAILYTPSGKAVCIDACIADTIKALWAAGVETLNSCCGHNGLFDRQAPGPSVVIAQYEDPRRVAEVLRGLDNREWTIYRWEGDRRGEYKSGAGINEPST